MLSVCFLSFSRQQGPPNSGVLITPTFSSHMFTSMLHILMSPVHWQDCTNALFNPRAVQLQSRSKREVFPDSVSPTSSILYAWYLSPIAIQMARLKVRTDLLNKKIGSRHLNRTGYGNAPLPLYLLPTNRSTHFLLSVLSTRAPPGEKRSTEGVSDLAGLNLRDTCMRCSLAKPDYVRWVLLSRRTD